MIEIRAIRPEELEIISRLIPTRQELFLVYPKGQFPFSLSQVKKLYQQRFEFTVICEDDTIDGFANLYDLKPSKFAFIGNLFIVPEYRCKGLGKVLMQYMIKAIFEKYRLPEARLSVFSGNQPAMALYREFGFELYDQEQSIDPEGHVVKLLHMKLTNPSHVR